MKYEGVGKKECEREKGGKKIESGKKSKAINVRVVIDTESRGGREEQFEKG